MVKMRSAYKWQGGKTFEAEKVIALIPVHKWYVEVFGGSFVLLLNKPRSEWEIGNDKFSCLINFWRCTQNSRLMRKLINYMNNTLVSRSVFYEFSKSNPEELSMFDRAYRFIYLSYFGFNGYHDTFYSPTGHRIGKLKDHLEQLFSLGRRLHSLHDRIKKVIFTNHDFSELLRKVRPEKGKFFLLDPPYINTHQYNRGFCDDLIFPEERYLDMRKDLKRHHDGGCMWMITCNEENTYFDDMDDVIIDNVERRTLINKGNIEKKVKTKIVMNYDVNEVGSCLKMKEKTVNTGGFLMT